MLTLAVNKPCSANANAAIRDITFRVVYEFVRE